MPNRLNQLHENSSHDQMEPPNPPSNESIAEMLERIADLLEVQHASVFRIRAYRAGAESVRGLESPLADLIAAGEVTSLEEIPAIGESLAALIREIVSSGRSRLLERLEGEASPADLFTSIPGIGEELAERIETDLHLDTFEELEIAAHDGRLLAVPGFGPRRVRGVQESLDHLLRHSSTRRTAQRESAPRADDRPSVATLLEVDRRYFNDAKNKKLRLIAPKRFNPEQRAWLPVLHCELDVWSLTAMFSNTARAHRLHRTGDWVVVYFEREGRDGQCTIVTEHSGPLKGQRVVRGREAECKELQGSLEASG